MNSKREARKNARKIHDDIWTLHRPEIERLFLREKIKLKTVGGEDGVIDIMRKRHGFVATEPQYENQLTKWGARKKIKKHQWLVILRAIQRRARQHKRSRVKFGGIVIDKERIARETARYRSEVKARSSETEGLTSRLPEDFEIYTPSSDVDMCDIVRASIPDLPTPDTRLIIRQDHEATLTHGTISRVLGNHQACTSFTDYLASLSWINVLNWRAFTQTVPTDQQLTKWSPPSSSQLNAIFHPMEQTSVALARQDVSPCIPRYLIFSIINDMDASGGTKLDHLHQWLGSIPEPVVLSAFRDLPAPVLGVLREKVFVAALKNGDLRNAQLMLQLGANPREPIMMNRNLVQPVRAVLTTWPNSSPLPVAKAIILHISQTATRAELDSLLSEIIDSFHAPKATDAEGLELMQIPISFGAKPTVGCFKIVRQDILVMKELAGLRSEGAQGWLQDGLLSECIQYNLRMRGSSTEYDREPVLSLRWVLSYLLHEHACHIEPDDHKTIFALSNAFQTALEATSRLATSTIFETCIDLGINLDCSKYGTVTARGVMYWCRRGEWKSAIKLISDHMRPQPAPPEDPRELDRTLELEAEFSRVVTAGDICLVDQKLKEVRYSQSVLRIALKNAARLGHDCIAVTIIRNLDFKSRFSPPGLLPLLRHGRTAAVSALIRTEQRWEEALKYASGEVAERNYIPLDDLLYRMERFEHKEPTFPGGLFLHSTGGQMVALRALAYYAIHTKDFDLLRWLVGTGLDMDELLYDIEDAYEDDEPFVLYRSSARRGSLLVGCDSFCGRIPSLLAIAAEQDDGRLVQFLLNEGAENVDALALIQAIKSRASTETVNMLLGAAEHRTAYTNKHYGVNAVRETIRRRNYDMLRLLADRTDIDCIDSTIGDTEDVAISLSPLGEAIRCCDIEAAQILLDKGARLDGLVTYDGIEIEDPKGTILQRVSPLLAAIDMGDLSMIQLLIQGGAEIDYAPRLGLLRTPLQRAAEIGSFKIVEYLLGQGVAADREPCYSGGTALQLAAIGGYCGVANLLIEHGADPNHAPAKGDGRTAFEGAAEWGRLDMVTLMMQVGINLDLKSGDSGETQCQRGIRFAEGGGHMAMSRIIRDLYQRHTEDMLQRNVFPGDGSIVMQDYVESGSVVDTLDQSSWKSVYDPISEEYSFDI